MKYIIELPEDVYKRTIFYKEFHDLSDCVTTLKALEKAVPLPKGHGDLIDRDQILQGEHFVVLGNVEVGDKNLGEHEIDMFPKQTIMNVKPIIEADKENKK